MKKRRKKLNLSKTTLRNLTISPWLVAGGTDTDAAQGCTHTTCTSYTGCDTINEFTCGRCATLEP